MAQELRREVTLGGLVLYGLGTTIGAGIYALTGEVAGVAGMLAPLAFIVAALLAAASGLAFVELTGRLPKAAAEAVFVRHAFGLPILTTAVGAAVVAAGLVAAAAITNAFAGYLADITELPKSLAIIEVGGLILILWYGRSAFGSVADRFAELFVPGADRTAILGVLSGAFLAFFAFLGFEDMDSVAEETVDARRTLPRAILWTLGVTSVLYLLISVGAVLTVPPDVLAAADAPLAMIARATGGPGDLLAVIGTVAMVNGALVQLIMVPRVLYGMARLGRAPDIFSRVNHRTATPIIGTVTAMAGAAILALFLDLGPLARITSALTIAVFATVNASLIRIKRRDGPTDGYQVPMWVPMAGITVSAAMFIAEVARIIGM